LMRVEGARFYKPQGHWLYLWECQREQGGGVDLKKWCRDLFANIQWSEDIAIASPEQVDDLDALVAKMSFAPPQLQKQETDLIAGLQKTPLTFNDLMAYGAFLMVRSLLYPPPEGQQGDLIENFKKMSLIFRKDPRYRTVSEWFAVHAEVLGGLFNLKKAKEVAQSNERPPFWLLSLWVEPLSPGIAASMIAREDFDKGLEHYVQGTLLHKTGHGDEALTPLNKSAGQFGALAWEQMARIHLEKQDRDKAKIYVEKILKKSPDHVGAKLLLARILEATEEPPQLEEAQKIYADLTAKKDLSGDEKLNIFLQKAKNSIHPEIQTEYYEKVLEIDPNHLDAIYALGRLYLLEYNDKKKGVQYFEKFIAKAPKEDERVQELTAMVRDLRHEIYSSQIPE
ncbi:MAG: tetratricopeptide repeat protein, partial [Deltaproteobacteria bacterium]|nr:tetratricopeptide repeat protein [Deltaproteobacteria bacterium]